MIQFKSCSDNLASILHTHIFKAVKNHMLIIGIYTINSHQQILFFLILSFLLHLYFPLYIVTDCTLYIYIIMLCKLRRFSTASCFSFFLPFFFFKLPFFFFFFWRILHANSCWTSAFIWTIGQLREKYIFFFLEGIF